jgi:hypothetical protein
MFLECLRGSSSIKKLENVLMLEKCHLLLRKLERIFDKKNASSSFKKKKNHLFNR